MQVLTKTSELQALLDYCRHKDQVSFIPTMGYLHEGHLSLIKKSKNYSNFSVVSIFVNPLQFNSQTDFERYPVNLERDKEILSSAGADIVFIPDKDEILPITENFKNYKPVFANNFEGLFRPGHFEGVCAIVRTLFDIIKPDFSFFGEKDFQQLRNIEQMVSDLQLGTRIIRGETIREPDGLAMSSRNVRLTNVQRKSATFLSKALFAAKNSFDQGITDFDRLINAAKEILKDISEIQLEYLSIIDEDSFNEVKNAGSNSRMIIAAYLGSIRLIDNVKL